MVFVMAYFKIIKSRCYAIGKEIEKPFERTIEVVYPKI
jgi:hypothetical protein